MNPQPQLASGDTRTHPNWRPVMQWETLGYGDLVQVWAMESHLYSAYVDDLTENGEIIWLIEHGTGSRRLFLRGDRVTLYQPKTGLAQLIGY